MITACTAAISDDRRPEERAEATADPVPDVEYAPGTAVAFDLYSDVAVHRFDLELSEEALADLRVAPKEKVAGALLYTGANGASERYDPVGIRLKGSSSFQPVDDKPALKVDFDGYVDGGEFHGHKHIGLHNNVWDASAMAETLAYRTWREADNPAPRTGYADVWINGELRGLYTLVEPVDGEFVDQWWEGPHGAAYEMTRGCDFSGDCSCWELEYDGKAFDEGAIYTGCAAAREGTVEAIAAAFDWDRLVRYLALERVLNHPDSYTFNLNNFHLYVGPDQGITLTPWGADSTFTYVYPPWDLSQPCEPVYLDADYASSYGWLARWCEDEPECRSALLDEMESLASLLEEIGLAGIAATTHERLRPHLLADPQIDYSIEDHDYQAACFVDWIGRRPDEVRGWTAGMR